MEMDYGYSEKRKTKNDKKAKRRFNLYRRGGKYRTVDLKKQD